MYIMQGHLGTNISPLRTTELERLFGDNSYDLYRSDEPRSNVSRTQSISASQGLKIPSEIVASIAEPTKKPIP